MGFMDHLKIITDDTLREDVRHGSSQYPFAYYLEDIWQFDFHCMDWHWHHELEFVYVREGTVTCLVGTDKIQMETGSGIFINSGILHRFEAKQTAVIPNIVFSPELLAAEGSLLYEKYVAPVLRADMPCQILTPGTDWQEKILQILTRIFSLQEDGGEKELQTVSLLLQMWEIFYRHGEITSASLQDRRINSHQARLQIMMQYIHENYGRSLTLDEIAAEASISKNSALQLFQKYIRTTPVAYLIQYRLVQAAKMLCTTEKSVSFIAEETGFSGAGYFCRKFKQMYHMTPNEYRRKGRNL